MKVGTDMHNRENEIDQIQLQWMERRFSADPKINALVRQRVEENLEKLGGFVSVASFERAALELITEKAVAPFRGTFADRPAAAPAVPPDVVAFIESPRTTTHELRLRYRQDPVFRKQFDEYEKAKGQAPDRQSGVVSLSIEEYHHIPAAQIAQKYHRDYPKGFRAAVHELIERKLI